MGQSITGTVDLDPLLVPFLSAQDESLREHLLAELLQLTATPIITKIVRAKLHVSLNSELGGHENQDGLEIASEVQSVLIAELRSLAESSNRKRIVSFPDYVAIKTFSACADYFREKNPQRWRTKNLLRRSLNENPGFALWRGEDRRWYAGLAEWREWREAGPKSDLVSRNVGHDLFQSGDGRALEPDQLLADIFEKAGEPLEFDRVIVIACAIWNVKDRPTESLDDRQTDAHRELVDTKPGIDLQVEQRSHLKNLWTEVRDLPVLQRCALLLNLRDAKDGSVIAYIPHLSLASRAEIAELLAIPYQEFISLWEELPLDDSKIAKRLSLTRQQVINLRKTARERLARRMKMDKPSTPGSKK